MAGFAALALLGVADTNLPPPVAPAILDVIVSPEHLRAGRPFAVTVYTTPDVTSLEAWVLKYKLPVPKTADGVFSSNGRVPWWARIYHGTFHVMFVGTGAGGVEAQMEADIRI